MCKGERETTNNTTLRDKTKLKEFITSEEGKIMMTIMRASERDEQKNSVSEGRKNKERWREGEKENRRSRREREHGFNYRELTVQRTGGKERSRRRLTRGNAGGEDKKKKKLVRERTTKRELAEVR